MEIEESELATLQTTLSSRPLNTKRKYEGYQNEFVKRCSEKHFRDGSTVTKGKLHLFLSDQVVGRESKKKKGHIVGGSTVCGYVNAIVDLYNQQVALRINSNGHPRSAQVKQLIKNVQAQATERKKRNYQDRGVGSLLDGFHSEAEFKLICDTFFLLDDLRGRAAFLVSHYGLLRGENIRDLELADMFSQKLDGEGFQPSTALVLLIQHGKTNTYGKLQHVGFMRNKNVHVCPIGAIAFYLFERFHVDLEPFPSFRQSQDWYDIKFLRGRNRKTSISYNTHKQCYEKVFDHLGLTFNKKTHINRQQGVRQLESCDVDASQTRRHGRWGMDTVEAVYSAPLAREAMRALSGHPAHSRLYYLERAIVEPPTDLQALIFPKLDASRIY
ncbi:Hypothetical protein PHPALM_844 [Phytophthora palmivora]|uniref:Ndc10 domain-containing protein n=1 Tax=Phytophthora palmivora TaxID=4796 RepID=A0A2P4YTU4_9STRA|nr:Hypothetical protein PHPALM_844 [Phytophthora palmivora]